MCETDARRVPNPIMKTSLCLLGALVICLSGSLTAQASQHDPLTSATEVIVVVTPGWDSPEGTLRRFERRHPRGKWKAASAPIPVVVGKNGLGWGSGVVAMDELDRDAADPDKKEGDGRAPAGIFRLSKAFGYAPQPHPGWKMPYLTLTA